MAGLIMAAQLIVGLAILVTLHELGHFMAARAFGIRVEKFYLFFDAWGFKFFSFKRGETEYGVGWLPLGGYVKIAGMIDESMDKEAMKQPPQPWEFRSKPAWQRLIVMVGGVTMNIILGIVIYSYILLHYDQKYLPNDSVKDGIYALELGQEIGLKTGDKIVAINGKPIDRFDDLLKEKVVFGCTLTVNRGGSLVDVEVPDDFYKKVMKASKGHFISTYRGQFLIDSVIPGKPAAVAGLKNGDKIVMINNMMTDTMGEIKPIINGSKNKIVDLAVLRGKDTVHVQPLVSDSGTIGISYGRALPEDYILKDYTLGSAFRYGSADAIGAVTANIKGMRQIFRGKESAADNVQGPIGIAKFYGGVWNWHRFWTITGLLSMILAFMNMLPIPALDGGHVVFLLIEAITRRKFSDKIVETAQVAGMIVLIGLMVLIFGNDIWKLFK